MNIDEAKAIFKTKYVSQRFDLADEHPAELYFKFRSGELIKVSQDDLEAYINFESRRHEFSIVPNECSILSTNYREQVLAMAGTYYGVYSGLRNSGFTFGEVNDGAPYCKISPASSDFVNFFRFQQGYLDISLQRMFMRGGGRPRDEREEREERELVEQLYRPITIKIYNLAAHSSEHALEVSSNLIEGCLFSLSYLKEITLSVVENWPTRQPRLRSFFYGETNRKSELPLPKGKPLSDLVRYYQRGMSAEDPVIAFLSYYQVLEYFFLSVSDEQLYQKLIRRLSDPKFRLQPDHLNKLIQDTLSHNYKTDETEMLKNVITKHIEVGELTHFIETYEKYLGEPLFTKKRQLFGDETEIKLATNHVIGNTASRVKKVRNALVHSSDRHERQDVFVPTSANEEIVRKELPLVRYLAERVIVGTMMH